MVATLWLVLSKGRWPDYYGWRSENEPKSAAISTDIEDKKPLGRTEYELINRESGPCPLIVMDQLIQIPYIKKVPIPAQFNRRLYAMLRTAYKR